MISCRPIRFVIILVINKSDFVITRIITDEIRLHPVLLPLLTLMKNSADQGGCYPQRPKAEMDSTLRDLQNSSYLTKAEFNNYFLSIQNISPFLEEFRHFAPCFSAHQK